MRNQRSALLAASALAVLLVGTTRSAEAGLSVSIQVGNKTWNANATNLQQDSNTGVYSFNGSDQYAVFKRSNGDFVGFASNTSALDNNRIAIQVQITNNSPGGSTAQLFNVTHDVRSSDSGNSTQSVAITATENAFTSPVGLVSLQSSFAGSGGSSLGFSSYVLDGATTLASITNQSPGAVASTPNFTIPTGTTYTVRNVTSLTIGADETVGTSGMTEVVGVSDPSDPTHPVPEPGTLALALTALVPLGLIHLRRSRKAKAGA